MLTEVLKTKCHRWSNRQTDRQTDRQMAREPYEWRWVTMMKVVVVVEC